MAERYAVLPCNGLDKAVGPLAREIAVAVVEACQGELVCPVLFDGPDTPARLLEVVRVYHEVSDAEAPAYVPALREAYRAYLASTR